MPVVGTNPIASPSPTAVAATPAATPPAPADAPVAQPSATPPAPRADVPASASAPNAAGTSPLNVRLDQARAERVGGIDYQNHVHRIVPDAQLQFDALPLRGETTNKPWSGDYWAAMNGGPAYRWRTDEKHTYALPTKAQLDAMSETERADFINKLSPAEKYDLLCGNFDFAFTQFMLAANAPSTPSWQGYCHGWTMAAVHFKEPQPIDVTSPDGLKIHFGSSDIKALLSYFQGEVVRTRYTAEFSAPTSIMGYGNPGAMPRDLRAYDVNPGSFHALLSNLIGMKDQAFGIDCVNGSQKWNQPVYSYRAEVLSEGPPDARASAEAVKQIVVRNQVSYALESHPSDAPVGGTPHERDRTDTYLYTVELDASGKICGGQWLMETADGSMLTYHQALETLQREGVSGDALKNAMGQLFRFPDYAYLQDKAPIAPLDRFRQAVSGYDFISNDKRKLWPYFAKLGLLIG